MKEALFLLAVGLTAGSLFLYMGIFKSEPIDIGDTVCVQASYAGYELHGSGRQSTITEICLFFADHGELSICGGDLSYMVDYVINVPVGTVFDMRVNPDSGEVLELTADGSLVMPFDDNADSGLAGNMLMAGICYIMAAFGIVRIIYGMQRRQK